MFFLPRAKADVQSRDVAVRMLTRAERIFIAYAHRDDLPERLRDDKGMARKVFRRIVKLRRKVGRERGTVFFDQETLPPGSRVSPELVDRQLHVSDLFVVLCGRYTRQSREVQREVDLALRLAKERDAPLAILPIVLHAGVKLPPGLDYRVQGIFLENLFPGIRWLRRATVAALVILLGTALFEGNRAYVSARIGTAQELADSSERVRGRDGESLDHSARLAIKSVQVHPTPSGVRALRGALALLPERFNSAVFEDVRMVAFGPGASMAVLDRTRRVRLRRPDGTDDGAPFALADSMLAVGEGRVVSFHEGDLVLTDAAGSRGSIPAVTDEEAPGHVALSRDGRLVAFSTHPVDSDIHDIAKLWDVHAHAPVLLSTRGSVTGMSFSFTGDTLVAGGSTEDGRGYVTGWTIVPCAAAQTAEQRCPRLLFEGHILDEPVSAIAVAGDAYATAFGHTVRIWKANAAEPWREIGRILAPGTVAQIAFDSLGTHLKVASRGRGRAWTVTTWAASGSSEIAHCDIPGGYLALAFDGAGLLWIQRDSEKTRIEVWRWFHPGADHARPLFALAEGRDVALSPDAGTIAAAEASGLMLRSVSTGDSVIVPYGERVRPGRYTGGGFIAVPRLEMVADTATGVWVAQRGGAAVPISFHERVRGISISTDGGWVLTRDAVGRVHLRRLPQGVEVHSRELSTIRRSRTVVIAPDASVFVHIDSAGVVTLRRVPSGRMVRTLAPVQGASGAAVSRDASLMAVSDTTGTIRVRKVGSGSLAELVTGSKNVLALGFSPDGSMLAAVMFNGDEDVLGDAAYSLRVWLLDPDDLVRELCRRLERRAPAECSRA